MISERGLQNKADDNQRLQWEGGEFPILCENCLGETPYVRMQRQTYGGTCKMCDRPFTLFKWRPGRGEGYKKTEVCQTCAKVKNLCQTCILDLQFGLPSQLRDAVLSQSDTTLTVPESDANREWFAQQHVALVASGNDPWQTGDTPNEKLLKLARTTAQNREQTRIKLSNISLKRSRSEKTDGEEEVGNSDDDNDESSQPYTLPLPPGISNATDIPSLPNGLKSYVTIPPTTMNTTIIPPLSTVQTTSQTTASTMKAVSGCLPSNETGSNQQTLPVVGISPSWSGNGGIPWFIPSLCFTGQKIGYYFKAGDFGLGYYLDPVQIMNYSNKMLTEKNGSNIPTQLSNMMKSDDKTTVSSLSSDLTENLVVPLQSHNVENGCSSNESNKDENISESKDLSVISNIICLPPKPKGPPPPWAFRK